MPNLKDLYSGNNAKFDINNLQSYLDNGDYGSMITELENVYNELDDYGQRNQLAVTIGQLKTQKHREDALLNGRTDDEVDAYFFDKALKTGIAPKPINGRENKYWNNYASYINKLGGQDATNLKFQFDNEDAYNDFLSTVGYSTADLQNSGIEFNRDGDGKPYVRVSKSDTKNMFKVLKAVNSLDDDRNSGGLTNTAIDTPLDFLINPYTRTIRRFKETKGIGDFLGKVVGTVANVFTGGNYDRIMPVNRVKLYGLNDEGNIVDDYDTASDKVPGFLKSRSREYTNDLTGTEDAEWYRTQSLPFRGQTLVSIGEVLKGDALGDGAMFQYNAAQYQLSKIKETSGPHSFSMTNLPFVSGNQARVMSYKDKNLITDEQYNNWMEREQANFDNALYGTHLSQYDVYASTEDGGLAAVPADEKHNLTRLLKEAIQSKRVRYTAAMVGPDMGVNIEILEKADDGNLSDDMESTNHGRTIFVKNLWPEYTAEAFNSNTQFKAAKEVAQMTAWGYTYELSNGYRIQNPTSTGQALYVSADDPTDFRYINQAEMQNLINEDYAKRDAIAELGILYEKQLKNRGMSLNKPNNEIDVWAANLAKNIAKESIPNTISRDYFIRVQEIYNELLNGINYKGDRTLEFQGIE